MYEEDKWRSAGDPWVKKRIQSPSESQELSDDSCSLTASISSSCMFRYATKAFERQSPALRIVVSGPFRFTESWACPRLNPFEEYEEAWSMPANVRRRLMRSLTALGFHKANGAAGKERSPTHLARAWRGQDKGPNAQEHRLVMTVAYSLFLRLSNSML